MRVESRLRKRSNLEGPATVVETDHRVAGDLILKAHASGTLDTALTVEVNQIAQGKVLLAAELFVEQKAALARAKSNRQVLQRAFTAFITNRAIERVGS